MDALPAIRVLLTRGGLPEAEHVVDLAVVREGRVVRAAGRADEPVFLRSSAKPAQALAVVTTGAMERFSLPVEALALACGSHGGEPFHVRVAADVLARIGLGPEALLCGAHPPAYAPAAERLAAEGVSPGALHNNCSGKHAGMLAACRAMGWETATYLEREHPLQQLNLRHVAAFAGLDPGEVPSAVDGCSVPTFHVPLSAAARLFARLASPGQAGVEPESAAAAERVGAALAAHPGMIGGTGRLDTDVIRVTAGRVLSKVGAEGVWCAGVRGRNLGIAVKCRDGNSRAAYPAGLAVLRTLGVLGDREWAALAPHHDPVLRNHRRIDVGRIDVALPEGLDGAAGGE